MDPTNANAAAAPGPRTPLLKSSPTNTGGGRANAAIADDNNDADDYDLESAAAKTGASLAAQVRKLDHLLTTPLEQQENNGSAFSKRRPRRGDDETSNSSVPAEDDSLADELQQLAASEKLLRQELELFSSGYYRVSDDNDEENVDARSNALLYSPRSHNSWTSGASNMFRKHEQDEMGDTVMDDRPHMLLTPPRSNVRYRDDVNDSAPSDEKSPSSWSLGAAAWTGTWTPQQRPMAPALLDETFSPQSESSGRPSNYFYSPDDEDQKKNEIHFVPPVAAAPAVPPQQHQCDLEIPPLHRHARQSTLGDDTPLMVEALLHESSTHSAAASGISFCPDNDDEDDASDNAASPVYNRGHLPPSHHPQGSPSATRGTTSYMHHVQALTRGGGGVSNVSPRRLRTASPCDDEAQRPPALPLTRSTDRKWSGRRLWPEKVQQLVPSTIRTKQQKDKADDDSGTKYSADVSSVTLPPTLQSKPDNDEDDDILACASAASMCLQNPARGDELFLSPTRPPPGADHDSTPLPAVPPTPGSWSSSVHSSSNASSSTPRTANRSLYSQTSSIFGVPIAEYSMPMLDSNNNGTEHDNIGPNLSVEVVHDYPGAKAHAQLNISPSSNALSTDSDEEVASGVHGDGDDSVEQAQRRSKARNKLAKLLVPVAGLNLRGAGAEDDEPAVAVGWLHNALPKGPSLTCIMALSCCLALAIVLVPFGVIVWSKQENEAVLVSSPTSAPASRPDDVDDDSMVLTWAPHIPTTSSPTMQSVQILPPTMPPLVDAPVQSPALAPTKPTSSSSILLQILSDMSNDNGAALQNYTSPQYTAYQWLNTAEQWEQYTRTQLTQRYALATFYYSTEGDQWGLSTNWVTATHECEWFSRTDENCNNNGQLERLELYYNNIGGSLPPELGLLSRSLQRIQITGGPNRFVAGTLPTELAQLRQLVELRLTNNNVRGNLPTELGTLSQLNWLDVSNNRLTGTIPTSIGNMQSLDILSLAGNLLDGVIPTEIGQLTDLLLLTLDENALRGPIPTDIGNLVQLRTLQATDNQLTSIPTEIGRLQGLSSLLLSNNTIAGQIVTEFANLLQLRTLSIAHNSLTGSLPTDLGMVSIHGGALDLSHNQLSGSIPSTFGTSGLWTLNLRDNLLTGVVPEGFVNLRSLRTLFLDANSLTGRIPSTVCTGFNASATDVYIDCQEVVCTCCKFCCRDGQGCAAQYGINKFAT